MQPLLSDLAGDLVDERGVAVIDVREPGDREASESTTQQVLECVELAEQVEEAQKQKDAGSCTGETGLFQGVLQVVPSDHADWSPDVPEQLQEAEAHRLRSAIQGDTEREIGVEKKVG